MERKTKGTRQNIYLEVTVRTCNLLLRKLGVELNEDKQKKKSCLFDFNTRSSNSSSVIHQRRSGGELITGVLAYVITTTFTGNPTIRKRLAENI